MIFLEATIGNDGELTPVNDEFSRVFNFDQPVDNAYALLQGFSLGYEQQSENSILPTGDRHFGVFEIHLQTDLDPLVSPTLTTVKIRLNIADGGSSLGHPSERYVQGWIRILIVGIKRSEVEIT